MTAETVVNHDEAWSLACYKREHSNLARCYIEAIELLRKVRPRVTDIPVRDWLLEDVDRVLSAPSFNREGSPADVTAKAITCPDCKGTGLEYEDEWERNRCSRCEGRGELPDTRTKAHL